MNEIKWNDRFNIGIDTIDKAHKKLFSIVEKLIALNEDSDKQQHACREGIKYFKSYTIKHFEEEEAYMRSINYSDYAMHKSLHDNMQSKTLPALERELDEQNYSVEAMQHFLGICVGWLNGHILTEDRAITGRVSNKWVHSPSEDEIVSLEKAILQSFQSLFHINLELISKHYSGEDFSSGSALCYRLNYISQNKEKLQVFVVYEERMVLGMLGDLLGKPVKKADKTVIYAVKILSQQFMDCIGRHFSLIGRYRLEKNDMLTFEQLLRTFEKEYPPYSMLFSAKGKGYFSLCIRT